MICANCMAPEWKEPKACCSAWEEHKLTQLREQNAKLQAENTLLRGDVNELLPEVDALIFIVNGLRGTLTRKTEKEREVFNHIDALRGCMCTDNMSDCCKPNLVQAHLKIREAMRFFFWGGGTE